MADGQEPQHRPNLFIIGAAKSGTTSLHTYLSRHPAVFMSDPKEPGHFVPELDYYPKGIPWYLGLFEAAGHATIIGESSTHYTKLPIYSGVTERVAAFNPDAKLIYLMRDPIDRAVSHYWHNARLFEESRPILTAVERDVQYRAFGDYAMQLRPWIERFPRDQILTLVFEEMVADPGRTLARVQHWLGLPEIDVPTTFEPENARPSEITVARGTGLLNRIRYSRTWDRLSHRVPTPVKELGKRLALRRVQLDLGPPREVVDLLTPWARASIADLQDLLGRRFDCWETSLATSGRTCGSHPGETAKGWM